MKMNHITMSIARKSSGFVEFDFTAEKAYDDPFCDIELNASVNDGAMTYSVPGFWDGGNCWKIRFPGYLPGHYRMVTSCSNTGDEGLHGVKVEFAIEPYTGNNPLFVHGGLKVSPDRRHFVHADGAPFFWLGDTWWMAFCSRMSDRMFDHMVRDRAEKGFSIIQLVAGLYPDMEPFDPRGDHDDGWVWTHDFATINPAAFKAIDRRIDRLVEARLIPCIVGGWGYYLRFMGVEKMWRHIRFLYARYGALPTVFALAGEAVMPWYLATDKVEEQRWLRDGWTEICSRFRKLNTFKRLFSLHSSSDGSDQLNDYSLIDFEMIQAGHSMHHSINTGIRYIREALARRPERPIVNSEVCYEGIFENNREDTQRLAFWSSILSGCCGMTYGANGIWQVNLPGQPFGPSPSMISWGNTPVEKALMLPGAEQIAAGKRFLEQNVWRQLSPYTAISAGISFSGNNYSDMPFAAAAGSDAFLIYCGPLQPLRSIDGLDASAPYWLRLVNPSTGTLDYDLGNFLSNDSGSLLLPVLPLARDWLMIIVRS